MPRPRSALAAQRKRERAANFAAQRARAAERRAADEAKRERNRARVAESRAEREERVAAYEERQAARDAEREAERAAAGPVYGPQLPSASGEPGDGTVYGPPRPTAAAAPGGAAGAAAGGGGDASGGKTGFGGRYIALISASYTASGAIQERITGFYDLQTGQELSSLPSGIYPIIGATESVSSTGQRTIKEYVSGWGAPDGSDHETFEGASERAASLTPAAAAEEEEEEAAPRERMSTAAASRQLDPVALRNLKRIVRDWDFDKEGFDSDYELYSDMRAQRWEEQRRQWRLGANAQIGRMASLSGGRSGGFGQMLERKEDRAEYARNDELSHRGYIEPRQLEANRRLDVYQRQVGDELAMAGDRGFAAGLDKYGLATLTEWTPNDG